MSANIHSTVLTGGQSGKAASVNQAVGELDAALSETMSLDLSAGSVSISAITFAANLNFRAYNVTVARNVTISTPSKKLLSFRTSSANTANVTLICGTTSIVFSPGQVALIYFDGTANGAFLHGVRALGALTDVDFTTPPTEGQFMRFSASSGTWKPWNHIETDQAGAYTFALSDASSTVRHTVTSADTFTIPPDSAVPFPVGTEIECIAQGAGLLTIAAGAGVTLDGPTVNVSRYQRFLLRKVATNEWNAVLLGSLSGGGGGASTFTALTDAPASYSGAALKIVRVNAAENALEFAAAGGGGGGSTPAAGTIVDSWFRPPAAGDFTLASWGRGASLGLTVTDHAIGGLNLHKSSTDSQGFQTALRLIPTANLGAFTHIGRVRWEGSNNINGCAGICVASGVGGSAKTHFVSRAYGVGSAVSWHSPYGGFWDGSSYADLNFGKGSEVEWFKIEVVGMTSNTYISRDGINWFLHYSEAFGVTITHYGFSLGLYSNGVPDATVPYYESTETSHLLF